MKGQFNNATWSAVVTGLKAVLGLVNTLVAVRLVGVDDYGHLITVLSVFVIYVSLNTNLYTILVVKLISKPYVEDQNQRSEILAAVLLLTILAIVTLMVAVGVVYWTSPSFVPFTAKPQDVTFLLMGALSILQIVTGLQGALVEAGGRLDLTMKVQLAGPVAMLVILGSLELLNHSLSTRGYLEVLCLAALLDCCLLWIARRMWMPSIIWHRIGAGSLQQLKKISRASGALQVTALLNLFLDPLNRILLGNFSSAASVTTYDLAMKVIWGIQSLFSSAMRVFLHASDTAESRIDQTYIQVISLTVVPALTIHTVGAVLLYCVARWWIAIDRQELLLFYSLAALSNLGMIFITPLYIRLINRQDLGFIVKTQTILALTNTTISIMAIPLFGLLGASIGLLIATLYNVPAIYLRYQRQVAPIDGISTLLHPTIFLRTTFVLGLLGATIYVGVYDRLSFLVAIALGASLCAVIATEPLARRIMTSLFSESIAKGKRL